MIMENQPELKELETLLKPYRKMMGQASDMVLEKEISSYPIFIVSHKEIEMGVPLVPRNGLEGKWVINVSSLEEFATKQLIAMEKVNDFKKIYKKPAEHLCLFVIEDIGATFVFQPRS